MFGNILNEINYFSDYLRANAPSGGADIAALDRSTITGFAAYLSALVEHGAERYRARRNHKRATKVRDASAAAAVITAARDCPVPEIARLGRTLHTWRAEFLAHFAHTDVSNGPTKSLNLKIKNTKRTARGFRNFGNYRLRLLLNDGRIQNNHQTSRIRTRRPSLVA